MPSDRNRVRPDYGEILNQDGKVYIGTPNPDKKSLIKYLYRDETDSKPICSAFKTDGRTVCPNKIVMGNGRCSRHGGKSLSGTAHPNFTNGRFSKSIPARLSARYEEALDDTKLADFTEDLAIIDARMADLFEQMDSGGGAEIFTEIQDAYKSFKYANADGDKQAMREALRRLDDGIKRGGSESYLWTEVRQLQEQRRKIVLAQAKHLQLTNQTITVAKANILISAILASVTANVSDKGALNRINQDFIRITQSGSRGQLKA